MYFCEKCQVLLDKKVESESCTTCKTSVVKISSSPSTATNRKDQKENPRSKRRSATPSGRKSRATRDRANAYHKQRTPNPKNNNRNRLPGISNHLNVLFIPFDGVGKFMQQAADIGERATLFRIDENKRMCKENHSRYIRRQRAMITPQKLSILGDLVFHSMLLRRKRVRRNAFVLSVWRVLARWQVVSPTI